MKVIWIGLLLLIISFPVWAQDSIPLEEAEFDFAEQPGNDPFAENELEFGDESEELSFDTGDELILAETSSPEQTESSLMKELMSASRFTLKHEVSYKTIEPDGIVNNRDSMRWEFSKFFGTYFFLQFDTKLNVYWGNDHRAEAEDKDSLLESNTKEAFLQISMGDTSIKGGMQILIWGESDGGAITDVISPRDLSELFFISLEESRIGQSMVVIDQYTNYGDWSLFYIPNPEFNEYPEKGTAYYMDAFGGQAEFQDESSDQALDEYGMRWKKTFGKSDLSFMAASLIENDYVYRADGLTPGGKMLITKTKQRFSMVGVTFNYVTGSFLYKGELGRKSPRSFNNSAYQIVKKDVSDVALGLEYSPGGDYTLGLEAVNNHIHDWEEDLPGTSEDTRSLVFSWSKTFLNEDLSLNWMSSYTEPYPAYIHSLRSSYKWDDHITFELEYFHPDTSEEENSLWVYRNEKRITLKAQIQF